MSIDENDVRQIAYLARLGVDENKLSEYANEINSVLGLVEQMNAVDTQDITPMAHPLHATQRLRADKITEPDTRDLLQSGAPDVREGLFVVPKVIE